MKTFGIFEIKTKLSSICEEVARTGESVIVTKRGKPFVSIVPLDLYSQKSSPVWEARERFDQYHSIDEDFAAPSRQKDPAFNPFDNNGT